MLIRIFALSLIFCATIGATGILAAPSGGRITAGDGELANPLNIIQHSEHLATSWESFDIASGEVVNITQPSASALISIKVRNGTQTNIDGTLNANGKVALENPAGVLFGAGSVVNVGGLLASVSGSASAGAVQANGVINAPLGEVHLQSLADNNVVNVGGVIEAQRIIVEGANEVKLGSTATLTAAKEVLVGGGFQGKGDIANSQKTIVESGALITSSRVIIWSDVSTNFQGNIEAEGGFVEVSGKKHLASFDILKIKAAKLLLDPDKITIGTDTTDDSQVSNGNIAAGDGGSVNFVISAAAIEAYIGEVRLAANEKIIVESEINKTMGGGLVLTAPTIEFHNSISAIPSGQNLIITASKTIVFSSDSVSIITLSSGNNLILKALGSPEVAVLNQNVTLNAQQDITLQGSFNIGTGTMRLIAGNRDTGTGKIIFSETPTLTAEAIFLTQDRAFFSSTARATFNIPDSGKPQVSYTGTDGTQMLHDWFVFAPLSFDAGANNINIMTLISIHSGVEGGVFREFSINGGLLDFGDREITLTTTGNIILPAGITEIRAASLTLTAANIGTGANGAGALSTSLLIDVEDVLFLSIGTLTSTADLTIEAESIILSANDNVIKARNINLTGTSETTSNASLNDNSLNFVNRVKTAIQSIEGDLTLDASGNITISAAFIYFEFFDNSDSSVTINDLTLKAGGEIVFTKDTNFIFGKHLAIGGTIKAESTDAVTNITTQHNLTLPATLATDKATTISGADIILGVDGSSGQDLTITATGTLEMIGNLNLGTGNLTLSATSGITFSAFEFDPLPVIITPIPGDISIQANNITLSGTIKAESIDIYLDGTILSMTQDNLTLTATGQIIFANDKATTITGLNITLISPTAQTTASDQDLTLTASGDLTLEGGFDIGNNATTGGTMTLTAGNADDDTGIITFTTATLTAKAISLTQDGAAFDPTTEPATFMLPSGVKPQVDYTGSAGTAYDSPSWAECASGATDCNDVLDDIALTQVNDINLADAVSSFGFSADGAGLLDLGNVSLTLITEGNIIIPASITEIRAASLTLTAANIGTGANGAGDLSTNLLIDVEDVLFLSIGTLTSTADLTIEAESIILSANDNVIKARNINLTGTSETTSNASLNDNSLNFVNRVKTAIQSIEGDLTLDASGNITISAAFIYFEFFDNSDSSVTINDLTLKAGGEIVFTKDTNFIFGNVALGGTIKAESTNGDVTTQHDLFLGLDQLTLATDKATTISGADIGLGTVLGTITGDVQDLTITATGTLGIGDNLSLGTGNLTLSATSGIIFSAGNTDPSTSSVVPISGDISIQANNITLSGTIKAESTDIDRNNAITTITQDSLTLTASGQIIFANDKATTITGLNITLISPTAQTTASDKDLTITASGDLTLQGGFNIGNDATTGGTMTLTAGNADDDTGTITFTTATLTAKAISLTQDGEAFDPTTEPATFMLPSGVKPQVDYTGSAGTAYDSPSWAECASGATDDCNDVLDDIALTQVNDINLAEAVSSFGFSADGAGLLDLGNVSLTLITEGNIIIPASITEIRAGSLTLTATTITRGVALTLTAGEINLNTNINVTGNLAITASTGAINFSADKAIELAGQGVALTSAVAQTTATTPAVTITTNTLLDAGKITLMGAFNFGGAVTLTTKILTHNDVPFTAPTLTFNFGHASLLGANFTIPSWLAAAGRNLTVNAEAGPSQIIIDSHLNLGTGALTLTTAKTQNVVFNTGAEITAASVTITTRLFSGDGATPTLNSVDALTITARPNAQLPLASWMFANDRVVSITVEGDSSQLEIGEALSQTGGSVEIMLTGTGGAFIATNASAALRAGVITLTAANANTGALAGVRSSLSGHSLELEARSGDLTLNVANVAFNYSASGGTIAGDITLAASGDIIFTSASVVRARNITLGGDVMAQNLALRAASSLNFSGATTINAADLTLTASTAGTASNASLTLKPTGTLRITDNADSDASNIFNLGTGRLVITSASFDPAHFAAFSKGGITFTYTGTDDITIPAAFAVAGQHLSITASTADIILPANILLGTGADLTLRATAGALVFSGAGATTITARAITLGSAAAPTDSTGAASPSDQAFTLTASGEFLITGNYDFGSGDVSLTYGGSSFGSSTSIQGGSANNRPTSFKTDSLTIEITGTSTVIYFIDPWMVAENRDLSITTNPERSLQTSAGLALSLGNGNFTSSSLDFVIGVNSKSIEARNIDITVYQTGTNEEIRGISSGLSITFKAKENISFHHATGEIITIEAVSFFSSGGLLSLEADVNKDDNITGEIIATTALALNGNGGTLEIGGILRAESMDDEGNLVRHDVFLGFKSTFQLTSATTIIAANVSFDISNVAQTNFTNANATDDGVDLTVNTSGNIVFSAEPFTIRPGVFASRVLSLGTGTLSLTAGDGATGSIIFMDAPASINQHIFTAGAMRFTQNGAVFDPSTPPRVTFENVDGDIIKPRVEYTGTTLTQLAPEEDSWFVLLDETVRVEGANITLTDILGASSDFTFESGVLDFGDNEVVLTATGDIIFPATLTRIVAGNLTLTAANIGLDDSAGGLTDFGALTFAITRFLTLDVPSLTSTAALVLEGAALSLMQTLALEATDITITMTSTGTGATSAIHNADNQSLTLSATTGNITLTAANLDLRHTGASAGDGTGEGNLTLTTTNANGEILFGRNTIINANNITLGGIIKAESGATPTRHDLTLNARAQIIFPTTKPTSISGASIALVSPTAQTTASEQNFTLDASGSFSISGNFDIGGGADGGVASLTYNSSPASSGSFTARHLTITYGGTSALTIQSWMVAVMNQPLTIRTTRDTDTGGRILINADINIGTGDLILDGWDFRFSQQTARSITAGNITLTARSSSTGIAFSGSVSRGDLTLTATDNIIIDVPQIVFNARGAELSFSAVNGRLSLTAGGVVLFTKPTTTIAVIAFYVSRTIKAQTELDDASATLTDLVMISSLGGRVYDGDFRPTADTTITGKNIQLIFDEGYTPAANTGANLTITASGNIMLRDSYNFGTGALRLTAGDGAGTGTISYLNALTLSAGAISLAQDGAVFNPAVRPATFSIIGGGKPRVSYTGADPLAQAEPSAAQWFELARTTFNGGANNIIIADIVSSTPATFAGGVLDFGNEIVELITSANIIFPDGITEIRAGGLILSAASIGLGDGTAPFPAALRIAVTRSLSLPALTLAVSGALVIEAAALNIAGDVTLSATDITLALSTAGEGAAAAIRNADNQSLTLTATGGDITLTAAQIDLRHASSGTGEGNLILNTIAGEDIVLLANTTMRANNITLGGSLRAQTIDPTDSSITNHNLMLLPRAQLNFSADRAIVITGGDITLDSPTEGNTSNQAFTLTANGKFVITGSYDFGSGEGPLGDVSLTYSGDVSSTGIINVNSKPTSFKTDSLTINITTTDEENPTASSSTAFRVDAWMAGEEAENRDLSITLNPQRTLRTASGLGINLGTGNLTLNALELTIGSSIEIEARNIDITLHKESTDKNIGGVSRLDIDITFRALENISFHHATGEVIRIQTERAFGGRGNLVLEADVNKTDNITGEIIATSVLAMLTAGGATIEIGGIIRAESMDNEGNLVRHNVFLGLGNFQLKLASALTIIGADVRLNINNVAQSVFATADEPANTGFDFTVNASGDIILWGALSLGTGTLILNAGVEGGTGQAIFNSTPTITAGAIRLSQNAAVFDPTAKPPATFRLPNNDPLKPRVIYTGSEVQAEPAEDGSSWFELSRITITSTSDINITTLLTTPDFASATFEGGVLNLGNEVIVLSTTANIIFPDGITEIRAGGLILSAASIGLAPSGGGGTGAFPADLKFAVRGVLSLPALTLALNGALVIEAVALDMTGDLNLTATEITITTAATGTGAAAAIRNADNQSLTLTATGGGITLTAATIDLRHTGASAGDETGEGNLTLNTIAGNDIILLANTSIRANNITLGGSVRAQTSTPAADPADPDVITNHNLMLLPRAQLNFADRAIVITGGDITLDSPTAGNITNQAFTLTANGNFKIGGNYDFGTGDVSLTYGGTGNGASTGIGTPNSVAQPTTFNTDSLTITVTGTVDTRFLINAWMVPENGENRDLSITTNTQRPIHVFGSLFTNATLNLGTGNLTLNSRELEVGQATSIEARNIDIIVHRTTGAASYIRSSNNADIAFRALENLSFHHATGGSVSIETDAGALVLEADVNKTDNITGEIITTSNLSINVGAMVEIGGIFRAESTNNAGNLVRHDIFLGNGINRLQLTSALTIIAKNVRLIFRTTPVQTDFGAGNTGFDLTVNASGNITLALANLDISLFRDSAFSIGTGTLILNAGVAGGTGQIIFPAGTTTTITAGAVEMRQNAAVFTLSTTAPATFILPENVKPGVRYTGNTLTQLEPEEDSWFVLLDDSIRVEMATITLADILSASPDFTFESGVLDFGDNGIELIATGDIIFPATLTRIVANSLTLTAANIGLDDGAGGVTDFAALTIATTRLLTLDVPSLTSTAALVLEGGDLSLTQNLTLTATDITLTMSGTGTGATSAIRNIDNQSLTLTATTGNITLTAANIDLRHGDSGGGAGTGEGNLALSTTALDGEILFPQATDVQANNITLGGIVKAESGDPAAAVQHDLSLTARAQIIFAAATTISGADITLASPTAQTNASNANLTLIAAGVLTMNGNYKLGTGDALFGFAGTAAQTPAPTTMQADNLTLIYTGMDGLTYAAWMAGDSNENRNLTLTSRTAPIIIEADINLGNGDLTINMGVHKVIVAADAIITANNISISNTIDPTTSTKEGIELTNQSNLTLKALGSLSLDFQVIVGADQSAVTLEAGGVIVFAQSTETTGGLGNLTLGGTIRAGSVSGESVRLHDLTFVVSDKITFANDKPTSIVSANITLTSPNAGTASNEDLTIIAAGGSITLQGSFDIGNDSTTGGIMTLGAAVEDSAGNNSGIIIFTGTPTLSAREIRLTQDGAVFPTAKPDVNFQIGTTEDELPRIIYIGSGAQPGVSWARQQGVFSSDDIVLEDEFTATPDDDGVMVVDVTEEDQRNFIINSDENFILPDGAVTIKANFITITAKSIRTATGESLSQPLVLEAIQMVVISADIVSTANIIIKAPRVRFSNAKPVRLEAQNIMIDLPEGMDESGMPDGNNQNVELVASGDIMFNNNINIGFGTLKLQANRIMAPSRNVIIVANRIVYNPSANENIGNFSIVLFSQNDIILMNNITANGNIILSAEGSIITPNAPTTIEAIGSSPDDDGDTLNHSILFEQKYGVRQNYPLTLKAAGSVTVRGRLDRGNATVTLDAGAAPADDTGARGALTLTSAFTAGSVLCPNAKAPICQ